MKDPVTRMKRQTVEWEQLFVNHISDKGLISRIYKDLLKLNSKEKNPNTPIRKWAKVGVPWWPSGQDLALSLRRPGSYPWLGNHPVCRVAWCGAAKIQKKILKTGQKI